MNYELTQAQFDAIFKYQVEKLVKKLDSDVCLGLSPSEQKTIVVCLKEYLESL